MILFILDWGGLISWVERVKGALLEHRLDALLDFAAHAALDVCGRAQVLDHVCVDNADVDVVDAEKLRVADQDVLEARWEE